MYIIIDKDVEVFKKCTYPGVSKNTYEISNYGSIKNLISGKIFQPTCVNSSGYVHTQLKCDIKNKNYIDVLIERIVAWEFVEGFDKSIQRIFVNHKDSIRTHNYYENLEWVTISENLKHAFSHGFRKPILPDTSGPRPSIYGGKNPNALYTDEFVHEICTLFEKGFTTKNILKLFNTTKKDNTQFYSLLMNIKSGKNWKHISSQYTFLE